MWSASSKVALASLTSDIVQVERLGVCKIYRHLGVLMADAVDVVMLGSGVVVEHLLDVFLLVCP